VSDDIRAQLAQRKRQADELRKQHTKEHYQELAEAKAKGIKVAWTPAGILPELLDAMGILTCSPENYSAICAAKQLAGKFCEAGEMRGLSPDVCAYGRCIMGMMWTNDGPLGPLPDPDVVILDPTFCDAHAKMWEVPAIHYNVPSFRVDGAFRFDGELKKRELDWRVSELRRLVAFCEEQLGVKFDYDKFKENMRIADQVRTLYNEMQNLRKERPCPRSTRETVADIFYIVTFPHSKAALQYFTLVAEECRERVKHKVGIVENERFRLFYDNIAIWYWLQLYDYFHERGAVFASDAYSNTIFNGFYADGRKMETDDPFEQLALRQIYQQVCTGVIPNVERYAEMVSEWHCDGAVIFVNRGCKVLSSGNLDKSNVIGKRLGLPILEFEGEMADPRSINRAEVEGRASMFLEMLATRAAQV
jgi:benzoyl-CoA reductase/2-hydroxyglutaryl-CoA dehydratase subunit BcrC/BadD/HgdB